MRAVQDSVLFTQTLSSWKITWPGKKGEFLANRINEGSKLPDKENVVCWVLRFGSQQQGMFIFIVIIQSQQSTLCVSVSNQSEQNRVSMMESD